MEIFGKDSAVTNAFQFRKTGTIDFEVQKVRQQFRTFDANGVWQM